MRLLLAASALALAFAGSAQAATITNGSFEQGTFTSDAFDTLAAGNTNITGWTIGGAGVDWIGSHWDASEGSRNVDMSALSAGSLSQTLSTTIGQSYKLTFDLAGNPDGAPIPKLLDVAINGGTPTTFAFDTTGKSRIGNMGWLSQTYFFTATSASSVLSFTSLANTPSGPALDNVAIAAVPEASTWAMMIAGFGLAGASLRRRRVAAAA
jgi:choice-of-anchor C domain-containing protein